MSIARQPGWQASLTPTVSRRMLLKLRLGEAPDAVPTTRDVRLGFQTAASGLDEGPVDRILRHHGGDVRISRVHEAARSSGQGCGHRGFDDLEHILGLSRTFRVDLAHPCSIRDLVDDVRQANRVEYASPYYYCSVPMAGNAAPATVADPPATPDDDPWITRRQVRLAEALAMEPGDPSVIVAVVDTGVRFDHSELPVLRPGYDTVQLRSRDLAGGLELLGDVEDPDPRPDDEVGHGTSCAGIIGAMGKNMPPGLAGRCSLMPIRVLGSARIPGKNEPIGIGAIPDIDAGVKRALDLGAKVINMSLGTPLSALGDDDELPHADVVRYGLAKGCILVAASGNSGQEEAYAPASLPGVIAVGSTGPEDRPSSFSTRGSHVALSAPGERILSTGLSGYQRVTGTSFAAPFVAATAALIVSRAFRHSLPVDGGFVSQILQQSVRAWPAGVEARGNGVGVLDAHRALCVLDERIREYAHESERGR